MRWTVVGVDGTDPRPPAGLDAIASSVEVVVLAEEGADGELCAALALSLLARPDVDAVARSAPVTDAVKEIDSHGRIVSTVDRSTLVVATVPVAVRRPLVGQAPSGGDDGSEGSWVSSIVRRIDVLGLL